MALYGPRNLAENFIDGFSEIMYKFGLQVCCLMGSLLFPGNSSHAKNRQMGATEGI